MKNRQLVKNINKEDYECMEYRKALKWLSSYLYFHDKPDIKFIDSDHWGMPKPMFEKLTNNQINQIQTLIR